MTYMRDYEKLGEVLKRVMATGVDEQQARLDICGAVADRKIQIRVKIDRADASYGDATLPGGNVAVPPDLTPEDLDWDKSRQRQKWRVGPDGRDPTQRYYSMASWGPRTIIFIELRTADVEDVLCGTAIPIAADHNEPQPEHAPGKARKRVPKKLEATKEAMRADIRERRQTPASLEAMLEKQLADKYHVSRDTARKARRAIVSEFVDRQ